MSWNEARKQIPKYIIKITKILRRVAAETNKIKILKIMRGVMKDCTVVGASS